MDITGFLIMDDLGDIIRADAIGHNLAFCCYECGNPIFASVLENERGSDDSHPAPCPHCGLRYFADVRTKAEKLYVHLLDRTDFE